MRNLLLTSALLIFFSSVFSQGIPKGLTASNGVFIGFYEYKAANYNSTTVTYPMIIFLHGAGERGNGTTQLPLLAGPAIPRYIKNGSTMTFTWNGKTETFIVLMPQLSTSYGSWPDFYIDEMIKYAKANLRVDTNRIFLTGLSMGGGGTWHYPSNLLVNAKHLAGIAPVCGTCSVVSAANIANAKLPVWVFHATNDTKVSISCATGAINSINANNPAVTPMITIYLTGDHGIWDKAYDMTHNLQNPNVFEWMLAQNKSLPPNKKPIPKSANATISSTVGIVTLNANGSSDPDGSIVQYSWTKISGPSAGNITTPTSANGITTITGLTTGGTYQYELKAVDNRAEWATTKVTVFVTVGGVVPPTPKAVAKAGSDFTLILPNNSVILDGSGSSSPNGPVTTYSWTKIAGPAPYTISTPAFVKTAIYKLAAGTYSFRLLVTDAAGMKGDDTVLVIVKTVPPPLSPVAKAGPDVTLVLPFNSVSVDGSGSSSPNGAISTYSWTKISGPAQYSMATPTLAKTTISNLVAGTYSFRLSVTDVAGGKDDDTVVVLVKTATPLSIPVAKAGSDITLVLPINSVSVDGSGSSSPNGAISTYSWTKVAGPAQYSIATPTLAKTTISNLVAGTYSFRLLVTDITGAKDDDTIIVFVNATSLTNQPPVARAGSDMTIVLPANQITLSGSGSSDPDGKVVAYAWIKVSGPTQGNILNAGAMTTQVRNLVQGTYGFRLVVRDSAGLRDDDTIIVKVNVAITGAAISKSVIEEQDVKNTFSISPNPATGIIELNYASARDGKILIRLYDAGGRHLFTTSAFKSSNQFVYTVDVSKIGNGLIYVQLIAEDGKALTRKFLKIK